MSASDSSLPETAVCLKCGYSLRGLPENVCPECGRGFEPGDRRTWYNKTNESILIRLAKHWSFAPPRWHSAMTIILTAVVLAQMAMTLWPFNPCYDAYEFLEHSILDLLLGLNLLLPLVMSYALRLLSCRRFRREDQRPFRSVAWFVLPACCFALLTATLYPWPFQVAFQVSRPWLNRAVAHVSPGQIVRKEQWIGLFPVEKVKSDEPGRVLIELSPSWSVDLACDRRQKPKSPHYFARVAPDWYIWTTTPLYSRWPHPATTSAFPCSPFSCIIHSALRW